MTNLSTARLQSEILKSIDAIGPFQAGDLIHALGATSFARIPKGAAGQVLRRNLTDDGYDFASVSIVEEGTFVPAISFGNASVGITYSSTSGNYRKLGSLVLAQGKMILSAKGSSVGLARITGLPFSSIAETFPFMINCSALASIVGSVKASLTNGSAAILYHGSSTGDAAMTDVNFTASADIRFFVAYFAAS